ncbi:hypothetical protein PJL18_04075 [Paenarthrobacter nicotinovorans]|nr:hypothetical protein [Paenarthrobacter nicotinovorans]
MLLLMDGRPTRLPLSTDSLGGLRRLVVVIEVLVGQATELFQGVLPEQAPLFHRLKGGRIRQQPGQEVRATWCQPVEPAEVVQPVVAHAVEVSFLQRDTGCPGRPLGQARSGITDPNHPVPKQRHQCLGDHSGGVGEVDKPCTGAVTPHRLGEFEHPGDGSQGVGNPACSGGLLAQQPQIKCNTLIGDPAGRSARPDGRENHVGSRERLAKVAAGDDGGTGTGACGHIAEYGLDCLEPLPIDVEKHQFADQAGEGASTQRPVHKGNPESATAGDHKPHDPSLCSSASCSVVCRSWTLCRSDDSTPLPP